MIVLCETIIPGGDRREARTTQRVCYPTDFASTTQNKKRENGSSPLYKGPDDGDVFPSNEPNYSSQAKIQAVTEALCWFSTNTR